MGHYASEMICFTCNKPRCRCGPLEKGTMWINDIDEDFSPIMIRDFDEKHKVKMTKMGPMPQSPLLLRAHRQAFETRESAEVNAVILLNERIAILEKRAADTASKLKRTKATLKKLTKDTPK